MRQAPLLHLDAVLQKSQAVRRRLRLKIERHLRQCGMPPGYAVVGQAGHPITAVTQNWIVPSVSILPAGSKGSSGSTPRKPKEYHN